MMQGNQILRRMTAFILAAVLSLSAAGCGCNQAAEESSSGPGVGPSAGAAAGDTDDTPATSSTDGVNQMTTPEYGTTTENDAGNRPEGSHTNNAGDIDSTGNGMDGSIEEGMTHSADAVGGGTVDEPVE